MYRSSSSSRLLPLFRKKDQVKVQSRPTSKQLEQRKHIMELIEAEESSIFDSQGMLFSKPLDSLFSFSSRQSSGSMSDGLDDFSTPQNPKDMEKYLKKAEEKIPQTPPRFPKLVEYLTPSSSRISSIKRSRNYSSQKSLEWNPPPIGLEKKTNISKDLYFSDLHLRHGHQPFSFFSEDDVLIDILASPKKKRAPSRAEMEPTEQEEEKDTIINQINRVSNSQNSFSSLLYLPQQKKKSIVKEKRVEEERHLPPLKEMPVSLSSGPSKSSGLNLSRDPSQDSNRYDAGFVSENVEYQAGRVRSKKQIKQKPKIQVLNPVPQFQSVGTLSKQSSVKVQILPEGDYAPSKMPPKRTNIKIKRDDMIPEEKEEESKKKKLKSNKRVISQKSEAQSKEAAKLAKKQFKEKSLLTIEDSFEEQPVKKKPKQKPPPILKDFEDMKLEILQYPQITQSDQPYKQSLKKDAKPLMELKHSGTIAFLESYKKQKKEQESKEMKSQKQPEKKKPEIPEERKSVKSSKSEEEKKSNRNKKKSTSSVSQKSSPRRSIAPDDGWNLDMAGVDDPFYNYSIVMQNSLVQSVDELRSTTHTPQKKKLLQKYGDEPIKEFQYLGSSNNYHNFFFPNNLCYTRRFGSRGKIKALINCFTHKVLWPFQNFVYYTWQCQEYDVQIVLLPQTEINLTQLLGEVNCYKIYSLIIPNTCYTSESEPYFEFECHNNYQRISAPESKTVVHNPQRHEAIVSNKSIQRLLRIGIEVQESEDLID